MSFGQWESLRDLLALTDDLEGDRRKAATGWHPAVDIVETHAVYRLTAEVPGVDPDSLTIQVQDGRLTLAGRRPDPGIPGQRYHRLERAYGPFQRRFAFPHPVDGDAITAAFADGVLTVTVPKASEGPRRVEVL